MVDDATTSGAEVVIKNTFRLGDVTVDTVTGEVCGPGGREQLDPKVMHVLRVLAEHGGHVVLREDLLARIWPGVVVTDDALSRCVYQLRRHLTRAGGSGRYKELLETFPKRGYRLNCTPVVAAPSTVQAAENSAPSSQQGANAPAARLARRKHARVALCALLAAGIAVTSVLLSVRADYFWRDPLANARFTHVTNFEGMEQDAAISRDGRSVAFLADRDGAFDVWLTEVASGRYRNLTRGEIEDSRNPAVRTLSFSPDGDDVIVWTRLAKSSVLPAPIELWAAPSVGGPIRRYLDDVAEVAWSTDGTRMIYRTPESGDPIFLTERNERVGRRIFVAPEGFHNHFPIWSPDGAFIYFVYGRPPDETDVYRIPATGGQQERMTFHDSRVTHPVFLDQHRLLYLATAEDGSGPWLYGMNVERRVVHRISSGLQPLTSLALSGDGGRLVATVTTPRASIWRIPLDVAAIQSTASRVQLPTAGLSPRLGPDYLLYLAANDGADGLWQLGNGTPRELWSGREGRLVAGPAIEPHGRRIALAVARSGRTQLYLSDSAGTEARAFAEMLDVRGAPAWSPDGRWIAIAVDRGSGPQLFKIPLDGGAPVPLVDEYSIDPAWSPDGRFLVYRGEELGPSFALRAVTVDGEPYAVPNLLLPRGARRFAFVAAGTLTTGSGLIVLKGTLQHRNFWLVDLATGAEHQLTDFGPQFVIGDFDVAPNGREIVFDRVREESDILMFEPL